MAHADKIGKQQLLKWPSAVGTVTSLINSEGLRSTATYPNSRCVSFTYDGLHRVDQITDDDHGSTVLADYEFKGYYLHQRDTNDWGLRLTFRKEPDLDGYDPPSSQRAGTSAGQTPAFVPTGRDFGGADARTHDKDNDSQIPRATTAGPLTHGRTPRLNVPAPPFPRLMNITAEGQGAA